jgi:hypothetical protein
MNKSILVHRVISAGVAGGLALFVAGPGAAAPVLSNAAVVKSAVASPTTDVRWRRWGWGGGAFAAGVIGGLALGALAAPPAYYAALPAYYGYYGYGGPYYAAPAYSYYGYGSGCRVYGGYGRPSGCW